MDISLAEPSHRAGYPPTVLFIPYWIRTVLQANSLNVIDVLNYSKLRPILSIEDLAECYCAFNLVSPSKSPVASFLNDLSSWTSHNFWRESQTPEQAAEFTSFIQPLGYSDPTISRVFDRLTSLDPVDPGKNYHSTITAQGGFSFILLEQGFINALEDKGYRLRLLSDYLKLLYVTLPPHRVSLDYPAFKLYLEHL
jgi:hypothetical protein